MIEDLVAHPLGGRPLPAGDLQAVPALGAADVNQPVSGLAVRADGHVQPGDTELLERHARDPLYVLLFHLCLSEKP